YLPLLHSWADRLTAFKPGSMGEVAALVAELDRQLAVLCDEAAVIRRRAGGHGGRRRGAAVAGGPLRHAP
ncbi:hypothetical protein TSOC_015382, partial [Tetrabaena socialis]